MAPLLLQLVTRSRNICKNQVLCKVGNFGFFLSVLELAICRVSVKSLCIAENLCTTDC